MEFFDEESRPRFLLQSRSSNPNPSSSSPQQTHLHKPTLFLSLFISAILLSLSIFYFNFDPFQSFFIWCSLSFLIGPFAPLGLTAGDIRVGQGPAIQPGSPPRHSQESDPVKRSRTRGKKVDQDSNFMIPFIPLNKTLEGNSKILDNGKADGKDNGKKVVMEEEKDWSDGDLELLKKQMVKNPVGMPGRWETVAEAFNGRHKVESVVKMAKSMGERRTGGGDGDSFSRFLKDNKAVDKRVDEVIESEQEEIKVGSGGNVGSWSSGEDIALLNALKAFPKDVAMRWEKITAALPGRSKEACMKRVADLKKDFRSLKATSEA